MPDAEHGHPGDRRVGILRGGEVDGVVGSDHEHHAGRGEIVVDLVQIEDDVVVRLRLGQQDVHVPRKTVGSRVDAEAHVDERVRSVTRRDLAVLAVVLILHRGGFHAEAAGDDRDERSVHRLAMM